MAPEARKGVNQQYREVFLPLGGAAPDDFKVVYKFMPIPYFLRYDLHVLVSNRRHQFHTTHGSVTKPPSVTPTPTITPSITASIQ